MNARCSFVLVASAMLLALSHDKLKNAEANFRPQKLLPAKGPNILSQSTTVEDVTLTITSPSTLSSGCANYITITLKNEGNLPIRFEPISKLFRAMGFAVTRRGKPVGVTRWGDLCVVVNPYYHKHAPRRIIAKGEELRAVVNLTRYFDISMHDEYEIVAKLTFDKVNTGLYRTIETKPLKFTVTIPDGESITLK